MNDEQPAPLTPGDHGDYTVKVHRPKANGASKILRHPNAPKGEKGAETELQERERLKSFARPLVYYSEFDKVLLLDWILKGNLAKGHTSYLFGPPGCGKSALLSSAAVHLGAGLDWHRFRVCKKFATVSFAMERADLVEKRVWAECQRDGIGEVPVTVVPGIINLMDPRCVETIIGTILTAEDKLGIEVGLASFDTFNKGIAAGGGDENLAKDQNRAWGHLRLVHERMARYHLLHIQAVGHTGKDESRGARGSNAADGDNDVSLQIRNDGGIKEVSICKANELPEGPLMGFKMQPFDTGLKDEDGDPIEVWIVAGGEVEKKTDFQTEPRLSRNQQTMFSILSTAGAGGLTTEEWNRRTRDDAGIGVKRKADLVDIRMALAAKI